MNLVVNNDKDLLKLKQLPNFPKTGIIGIDGATQCGKSTIITAFLARTLKAKIIDLDSYIQIDQSVIYKNKPLIFKENVLYVADGILNGKILEHFQLKATLNIYVKKISLSGWTERGWLDQETVNDYGIDRSLDGHNIDNEIFKYHMEYHPIENADVVIELAENYITKDFYK